MGIEDSQRGGAAPADSGNADTSTPRMARRAAIARIAGGGATGVALWVVPQILTAKPNAAGAVSAAPTTTTLAPTTPPTTPPTPPSSDPGTGAATAAPAPTSAPVTAGSTADIKTDADVTSLADTGLDLRGQAEIGAVMVAAGWVVHRWASRVPSDVAEAHSKDGPAHGSAGGAGAAPPRP